MALGHAQPHRQPATGAALAKALSVSWRTLCRDIATLRAHGAPSQATPASASPMRRHQLMEHWQRQMGFELPRSVWVPSAAV